MAKSEVFANKINYEYKSNKIFEPNIENEKIDNECIFWPKINKNQNLNLK